MRQSIFTQIGTAQNKMGLLSVNYRGVFINNCHITFTCLEVVLSTRKCASKHISVKALFKSLSLLHLIQTLHPATEYSTKYSDTPFKVKKTSFRENLPL